VHVTIAMLEPEEVFALWWLFAKDKIIKNKKQKSVGASDAQYSINYWGILHFV
jgi:hypothetical protein